MDRLRYVRDGWDEVDAEHRRLLRQLTIAESVAQYVALQEEFEPWLQRTEAEFRAERNEAMVALQARVSAIEHKGRIKPNLIATLISVQHNLERAGLPSMAIVGIIRRQGDRLDDAYILDWLRQFEQALDDSTLVQQYRRLRH